jgi:acyl-CoA synthetase (AMP-forming)/AMP-acid ligase II
MPALFEELHKSKTCFSIFINPRRDSRMTYLFDRIVKEQAKKRPDQIFIFYRDQQITYGAFNRTCNQMANALKRQGMEKGAKALFFMPNCPESLYVLYGAPKAGMVAVPVNWLFKGEELEYCINITGAEIAFTVQPYTEIVKGIKKDCPKLKSIVEISSEITPGVISFSDFISQGAAELSQEPNNHEDDLVLIQFTSGTTGKYPKGVMHTHKTISICAHTFNRYVGLTDQDCSYNVGPLYHNAGLAYGTHAMTMCGGKQYMVDKFSVSKFWDDVKRCGCTYFNGFTTMFQLLLQQPEKAEDKENTISFVLGSPSPAVWDAFEERFGCVISQGYCSTEDTLLFMTPLDRKLRQQKMKEAKGNYVGKPIDPSLKQVVWDEQGNEVGPNVVGEVVRKSPATTKGYYNDQEKTAEAFKDGWLRMGDSGYYDEEGHFFFVDRLKDLVRRGGENISSKEVENVLMEHPAVEVAAVIPVPDLIRVEEVKAYIIPRSGMKVTAEDLWEFCEPKLADYKIPRYIEFREELPITTGTFRVKKNMLKTEREDLISGCPDRVVWKKKKEAQSKAI